MSSLYAQPWKGVSNQRVCAALREENVSLEKKSYQRRGARKKQLRKMVKNEATR
ncbi:MAG: hypothetical protein ABI813_06280 [Bacteroidota bacterium]